MPDWITKSYKKRKRVQLQGQVFSHYDHETKRNYTEIEILSRIQKVTLHEFDGQS